VQINQPGRKAGTPSPAVNDISFLLGWARTPERWKELLEAADAGQAPQAETAAPPEGQIGVALIGRGGEVAAANPAGWAVCEQRLGLIASRGEKFLSPANHEALAQARRSLDRAQRGQLIVKLTARDNDGAQFAYACAEEGLPDHLADGLPDAREGRLAVVFPAVETSALLAAALRASFGLTPAEARLAALLRDGASLAEAADELAVSVNTTRNQLRAIFEKMGLHRQADLVRALSQLAALASLLPSNLESGASALAAAGGAINTAPAVRHFRLKDGRRLAWRDYGARDGKPVLIVHQGLGGSLYPRGTDALARDLGLRLIVPARPGVGTSDPRPRYSYEGVAADMVALLDSLGVERLQIGCVLDGAPYALAAAIALGDRLSRMIVVNPRPPGWRTSVNRDLAHPLLQFRRKLARNPWLADVIYPMMRMRLSPKGIERFVTAGATAPADAAYLASHPDLMAYSVEYVTDGFVPSARGMIDSTKCAARSPPLDIAAIAAPLTVWLGAEDPMLSQEEVRAWLGDKLEGLRLFPNAGNFLAYQAWPEMLAWLAEG
jgi:pimeloyl-ACP methyl ester carboxylesterase/DNA-binding CsgD family transcriptional regulator